jgi:hypothetical protein
MGRRVVDKMCEWLDEAGEGPRDRFESGVARLFEAIYGRTPDDEDDPVSDHVYAAAQAGLTSVEARRVAAALREL